MAWAWTRLGASATLADALRALDQRLPSLADAFNRVLARDAAVGTFADGETRPSIAGYAMWVVRNSAPTSIVLFREGQAGQRVTCWFANGSTTLVHSATLVLIGGVNVTPTAGMALAFVTVDGSIWTEVGR